MSRLAAAPPWLVVSLGEIGVREVPGKGDNPRIREYHGAAAGVSPDSVPWCSSHANWALNSAGFNGTASKRARSWLEWGKSLEQGQLGAVCVLWRKHPRSPAGHVGFWIAERNGLVYLLGGNQGDEVSIRGYPVERVIGYRWPMNYEVG